MQFSTSLPSTTNPLLKLPAVVIFGLIAFSGFLFLSNESYAMPLFDNGEPIGGNGQWIGIKRDGIRPRIANDFLLGETSLVTGMTLWTVEDGLWNGTLEYFIFEDDAGLPANDPLAGFTSGAAVNVTRELVGTFPKGQEYKYTFNFANPVVLLSSTVYWIGLHMDTVPGSSPTNASNGIFWEESSLPGFGAEMVISEGYTNIGLGPYWQEISDGVPPRSDGAFLLHGEAIPESAAVALMTLGLVGIGLARKKQ